MPVDFKQISKLLRALEEQFTSFSIADSNFAQHGRKVIVEDIMDSIEKIRRSVVVIRTIETARQDLEEQLTRFQEIKNEMEKKNKG